jgi:hypothetical protein
LLINRLLPKCKSGIFQALERERGREREGEGGREREGERERESSFYCFV